MPCSGGADPHVIPCTDKTCKHGCHVPRTGSAVEAHAIQQSDELEPDGDVIVGQDLFAVRKEEGFHLVENLAVTSQCTRVEQFR